MVLLCVVALVHVRARARSYRCVQEILVWHADSRRGERVCLPSVRADRCCARGTYLCNCLQVATLDNINSTRISFALAFSSWVWTRRDSFVHFVCPRSISRLTLWRFNLSLIVSFLIYFGDRARHRFLACNVGAPSVVNIFSRGGLRMYRVLSSVWSRSFCTSEKRPDEKEDTHIQRAKVTEKCRNGKQ